MCGICGIYNLSGEKVDIYFLRRMRDVLAHRGPDGKGEYVDGQIGLGHRRLSVIDIEGGHQPMCNEDGSIWIVFNGEIYNFGELRPDLEKDGHIFRSKCDTEVIIHLYEGEGEKCLEYMNGMFAFAIWDSNKKELFLARDRVGKKPLYFYYNRGFFIFASEIKSIISCGKVSPIFNRDVLKEYLLFRYISGMDTLFKDIKSLEPGHCMKVTSESISIKKYWDIDQPDETEEPTKDVSKNAVLSLLKDSICKRLVSDVPIGCFCSGGLDSSLVTAIVAGLVDFKLSTYSIGFEEKEYDERKFARKVAEQYSTIHNEVLISNKEFSDALPKAIWYLDEPLNHANSVQIYLLSRYAKNYVTVILTGEGADEIFAGYPRYLIPKAVSYLKQFPEFIFDLVAIFTKMLKGRRITRVRESLFLSKEELAINNGKWVSNKIVDEICADTGHPDFSDRFGKLNIKGCSIETYLNSLLILDQKTYLVSILNRADKMSMAAGIELRVPFLDYRLLKMVNSIQFKKKLRFLTTKNLLKEIARDFLPADIVYRRKVGFGNPIDSWLRDSQGLGRYFDFIRAKKFEDLGLFNNKSIEKLITDHKAGVPNGDILWQLINLAIWYDIFF